MSCPPEFIAKAEEYKRSCNHYKAQYEAFLRDQKEHGDYFSLYKKEMKENGILDLYIERDFTNKLFCYIKLKDTHPFTREDNHNGHIIYFFNDNLQLLSPQSQEVGAINYGIEYIVEEPEFSPYLDYEIEALWIIRSDGDFPAECKGKVYRDFNYAKEKINKVLSLINKGPLDLPIEVTEKCLYGDKCKNKITCGLVHIENQPIICRNGDNCQYIDKCMFFHPEKPPVYVGKCSYGSRCKFKDGSCKLRH